jgi:hypothetical protein
MVGVLEYRTVASDEVCVGGMTADGLTRFVGITVK